MNVALLNLTEREQMIADLWLAGQFEVATFQAGDVARGNRAFPLQTEQLPQLAQWGMPFMVIGSRSMDHPGGWQTLYETGSAACWLLPARDPIILPEIRTAPGHGTFLLPVDNKPLRGLFRQIGAFAGFDARTDFKSTEELLNLINILLKENQQIHAFVDLDSEIADPVLFCYKIAKLFSANSALKQKLHIWLMRDFSKPGLDPVMIRNVIRPFAKRIFHPLEALLAMVEALFLHDPEKKQREYLTIPDFRSTIQLLYGQHISIPDNDPWAFLSILEWKLSSYKRALPFLWLFRLFASQVGSGSVTLSPEPVIDSGNSLH